MENQVSNRLIVEATSIEMSKGPWLIETVASSETLLMAVLGDPHELERRLPSGSRDSRACWMRLDSGASPSTDRVVRDLNVHDGEP